MRRKNLFTLFIAVLTLAVVSSAGFAAERKKKLIYFGWDLKSVSELAVEIDQLQFMPFDGMLITSAWCYPFYTKGAADPANDIKTVKTIKWDTFTDNFMYLTAGKKIDWFDDSLWTDDSDIIKNVQAVAKLGAAAGCKGVFFEPEFVYWGAGDNTWNYASQERKGEKTFAQFEEIARKRGKQFIDVIEEHMPNTVFLSAFWGSQSSYIKAGKEAAMRNDPKLYAEFLSGEYYGLLNAFMSGVLEGADPGTKIIDGNEHSYYNSDAKHYFDQVKIMHDHIEQIPPDLQLKYTKKVKPGHAIYADYLTNKKQAHGYSTYMTHEQRGKWVENNVYWALETAEEYVWYYSELVHYTNPKKIPPKVLDAIKRAKEKVDTGNQILGFSMQDILNEASQEYSKAQYAPIEISSANVGRRKGSITVDGKLDDPGWKTAAKLTEFKPFKISVVKDPEGKTETMAAYDDQNLYFAVTCDEPSGIFHATLLEDYACKFGKSDQVDFIFDTGLPGKYYHIMHTVDGSTWDALTDMAVKDYVGEETYGFDSSWSGEYQSVLKIADDKSKYTVEIAIPWKTIDKEAPKPGDTLKGNVLRWRHRNPAGIVEFTSWSQRRNRREVEMNQFGTWTFE